MDDGEASNRTHRRSLDLIAIALNVPVDSFYQAKQFKPLLVIDVDPPTEDVEQALIVMRLFLRLKDPEARARCVGFITQELTNDG
ncbi:hypothetical protein [Methylobacterium goesingense]|uniref:XRE family transcriptional regulator n=1 Tax=Methylobacterium goesingense TaxID=243690 RepID=A0ABV2LF55_9HYPH|nr:hypothetical protein [Methylobacterium goesingense]GJD73869.1 hypothetical protein CFIICLFH_2099 [Methylobacterium goesingense]